MSSGLKSNQPGYYRIFAVVDGKPTAYYNPPTDDEGKMFTGAALSNDLKLREKIARNKAKRGDFSPASVRGEFQFR